MQKVKVIFGTVYGSAQFTAETVTEKLLGLGYDAKLVETEQLADFIPQEQELLLVVSSTTGQGDLPDNIFPWFLSLQSQAPYLPKLQFSIIGLGDSSYENYCGGAEKIEALLLELGARPLTPLLKIDAVETMEPEQEAIEWISVWHEAAQSLSVD